MNAAMRRAPARLELCGAEHTVKHPGDEHRNDQTVRCELRRYHLGKHVAVTGPADDGGEVTW